MGIERSADVLTSDVSYFSLCLRAQKRASKGSQRDGALFAMQGNPSLMPRTR
jgi:hypothetical protein